MTKKTQRVKHIIGLTINEIYFVRIALSEWADWVAADSNLSPAKAKKEYKEASDLIANISDQLVKSFNKGI